MKKQFYFFVLISLRENEFLCEGLNRIVFVPGFCAITGSCSPFERFSFFPHGKKIDSHF